MTRNVLFLVGLAGAMGLAAACSSSENSGSGKSSGDSGQGAAGGGSGSSTSTDASGTTGGGFNPTSGVGGSTGGATCASPPDADGDMDGFTGNDGDCNDCDPNVNPGAIEVATPMGEDAPAPADENCDMLVDNVQSACDENIALDDFNAMNGAKAIELCQSTSPGEKQWGVLNAAYVRANGSPANQSAQAGILNTFGPNVNVQGGKSMLALSSGRARLPGQPGACGKETCGGYGGGQAPDGFPQSVPSCPGVKNINDDVGLELKLRAPKNATGYQFFFKFQSFEYSEYVCTNFNDQFIALVDPAPMGSINGNISFDKNNNPVSVNLAFFTTCAPKSCQPGTWAAYCNTGSCPPPPNPCCEDGPAGLQGTGFDGAWGGDAGATAWLRTAAPISGGEEFSIRFAIWDTGDTKLDSTVLVDNFSWVANGGTVVIGTTPVEDPK